MPPSATCRNREIISVSTPYGCPPLGHYSQVFRANGTIYVAGQIPADNNGKLDVGIIEEKTALVYLKDLAVDPRFNSVYNPLMPHAPPRTTVEFSGLPLGVDVEVDIIVIE
ncbi:L-PSP endoribonuclease family protein-like protein [Penicillium canescens]|nr:L-PSP endoribonuclease family protein-like protein [Penicillium canescens]